MNATPVEYDERTLVVENASYRWGYLLVTFGLLADVAYRSFVLRQASWDLLVLVVAGGLAASLYQGFHRVISRRWMTVAAVSAVVAAVVAVVVSLAMQPR